MFRIVKIMKYNFRVITDYECVSFMFFLFSLHFRFLVNNFKMTIFLLYYCS